MAKVLLSTTVIWPASARLAEAFAACGARVEAIAPHGHPLCGNRSLSRLYRYRPLKVLSGLQAAMKIAEPDIIVPCDDRAVRHLIALAEMRGPFTGLIERSIGCLNHYGALLTRGGFMNEAAKLGIKTPTTVEVAAESNLEAALYKTGLPAVIKIDGSWGGEGVSFAHNFDEAVAAFRRLAHAPSRIRSLARTIKRRDAHFLLHAIQPQESAVTVQSLIEGRPATCAFACWSGDVLASLRMDVAQSRGPAGPATVLHRTFCTDMEETARCVAKAFGLSGFHGLDFMRDALGRAFLIEINPRATQICHLALGPGHDLPAALLAALENREPKPRPAMIDTRTIALFSQNLTHGPNLIGAYHDIPADNPGLHAYPTKQNIHRPASKFTLPNARRIDSN